jgi:hypothetical protein
MRRLLVAGVALLLLGAAPARADDTYTVDSCLTAAGTAATVDGWSFNRAGIQQLACPRPGITASEPPGPSGNLEGFNLTFTAPPPAQIVGYRLWRRVTLQPNWNYTLYRTAPTGREEDVVERCWTIGNSCFGVGDENFALAPDVTDRALSIPALVLHVDCQGSCAGGGPSNVRVGRLQVDLSDRIDPTLAGVPSGDLFDPATPLTGVRSVSFSASDQGSGVYTARVEVDGRAITSGTVDDNGGRCVKPFKDLVPCKATASGTLAVDTATLPDGPHSIRLVVTDATGTNTVTYGPVQVTTSNQAAACEGAVSPVIAARFLSTKKATYTRRGGGAFSLTGTAPAGAGLTVLSLDARTGAGWAAATSGVAGADGTFRLKVPAGPSRSLRVAFRASPLARELSCSNVLQVRVPARVTLTAKRSAKRRYRISGRLLGGFIPARGKLVELQAYERGKWRSFGSARSGASGRYAYRYTFRAESIGRRFRLRARVRADSNYPFSLGYSKVLRVRVR